LRSHQRRITHRYLYCAYIHCHNALSIYSGPYTSASTRLHPTTTQSNMKLTALFTIASLATTISSQQYPAQEADRQICQDNVMSQSQQPTRETQLTLFRPMAESFRMHKKNVRTSQHQVLGVHHADWLTMNQLQSILRVRGRDRSDIFT
jgi:hypothetical protein